MTMQKRAANRVFALVFGLFGGVAALAGLLALGRGAASASWPRAEGTILRAEAVSGVGTRSSVHYRVRYSYTVGHQAFASDRLTFVFDRATFQLPRYAVGQQVPVYYDPAAPSAAVLVKGIQPYPVVITLFGVLFIAIGWVASRFPSLATRPQGSR
ncbi:MAG TPA: DUF3592 domain-containing protein [Holophagaceae bacterium]